MRLSALNKKWSAAFVAAALACSLIPVADAGALPATPSPEIEQKEAERAATLADLQRMQQEVARLIRDYVELGRKISQAQAEVSQIEREVVAIDGELAVKEKAVRDRTVELYRSDNDGMLVVLLGSESFSDFMSRAHYLMMINDRDNQMRQELRLARSESLWLHSNLTDRVSELDSLQQQADVRRQQIEQRIAVQEANAQALGQEIANLMRQQAAAASSDSGGEPTGEFDPDTVIADAAFRDVDSMSVSDIQTFLDRQPGTLKSYRAPDYAGRVKSAAQMIADAAVASHVSPKVILVKLQKEQSLLADPTPTQEQYDWATGCGRADSRTYYQYQGFGKQVWYGASKLDTNCDPWKSGISMRIDGSTIHPTNSSTYSLYKYTPHFKGTMSFWLLYWRYFGDPLGS